MVMLCFYTLKLVVCNVGKLAFLIILIIANQNRQNRRFLVPEHSVSASVCIQQY